MKNAGRMKNIVVGVDFSPYSKIVVKQARTLARKKKAKLTFVCVLDDPFLSGSQHVKAAQNIIMETKEQVEKFYKLQGSENLEMRVGTPYEEIISVGSKLPNPLIVVGYRGNSSMVSRYLLGTTAERLALNSPYPVWIHRSEKTSNMNKIFVPCDLSERTDRTLEGVKKLGFELSDINLHHVFKLPMPVLDYGTWTTVYDSMNEQNQKQKLEFEKKHAPLSITETSATDISSELSRRSKSFDVVALTPRPNKTVFSNFGRVTSRLIRTSQAPVLILP